MGDVRILIADDHALLRQGLRQVIESVAGLTVVAEAENGRRALENAGDLRPDIVLLDVDMPEVDGIDAARAIRKLDSPPEIIFLTVHREPDLLNEALAIGAKGYVLKDSAISDIVAAIHAVAGGNAYTSPAITSYLVERKARPSASDSTGIESLTPTEKRILSLIADYKTSKQIAAELFISHRTVQTHRTNICQKLQLEGSHALMKFALTHKD
ncbi:MAG: response regulator [Blastocatellia bacterium]